MSERILRWGLLSTAHINQALIPPLRLSPRNRLEGVASRSQAQAGAYAQAWGIPRARRLARIRASGRPSNWAR